MLSLRKIQAVLVVIVVVVCVVRKFHFETLRCTFRSVRFFDCPTCVCVHMCASSFSFDAPPLSLSWDFFERRANCWARHRDRKSRIASLPFLVEWHPSKKAQKRAEERNSRL